MVSVCACESVSVCKYVCVYMCVIVSVSEYMCDTLRVIMHNVCYLNIGVFIL